MKRVHVVVRGEVQGVGYRYTMRMVARDAGVSGWVRNRRDGSVEAEIEGTPEQVDEVVAWMAEGPPGSHVREASVTDAAPTGSRGFDVLPTE
ncbi:acylphosphatase [Microbacterium sp.]|jgi:acylphosphatase|uniref:acylphosphatase n=1 Tax=Microbacterium sp. TaxID=51671 RepID=UPI002B956669|nr:acylphosphatase [Microbacterium sp.]HWL77896.1 acylphosphatase [Microbacterium sp.]